MALPFGSPVNTNYALLRKIRNVGFAKKVKNEKEGGVAKGISSGLGKFASYLSSGNCFFLRSRCVDIVVLVVIFRIQHSND